jgi:hypothetical protein
MSKSYTPSGTRASLLEWELNIRFKNRDQMKEFIKFLIEEENYYNFETHSDLLDSSTEYVLNVECSWANNLKRISELLEKVDFDME